MPSTGNINLLKTETTLPAAVQALQKQLRSVSIVVTGITVAVGLLVAATYGGIRLRHSLLTGNKGKLTQQINSQSQKEGIFLSLKARTDVVGNIMSVQKSWIPLLEALITVSLPPKLSSVIIDEEGKASIVIRAESLEEAASATSGLLRLNGERVVRLPQLVSLTLDKDGIVRLVFAFFPGI